MSAATCLRLTEPTCRRGVMLASLVVLLAGSLDGAAQPRVVSLSPLRTRLLTSRRGHEGQTLHERTATFDLGATRYGITYKAAYDPENPGRAFPLEGYVGMPLPAPCNWYHSGFLAVQLDGKDIGDAPLSSMTTTAEAGRGMVDLVWHHDLADVRLRFLGVGGEDLLYCIITLDPVQPLKSLTLKMRCYPSFFTSHHRRVGARRIGTPATTLAQGETTTLEPAQNWWLCYYDEVFDVARGEGSGPCALALLPEQVESIRCSVGGYSVDTLISCNPQAREIRLALWDLKGRSNQDALACLAAHAANATAALRTITATPQHLAGATLAAKRQELQDLLASENSRNILRKHLPDLDTFLDTMAAAIEAKANLLPVRVEEHLLQSLERIESATWEARLADILEKL